MPEERPIITTSRVSAGDVARHTFSTVRRGFDPHEVRAYLEGVARELQAFEQHDEELRQRLAAAEERALHPVLDEGTLSAALGQQSGQLLRNAHEEAARITQAAEEAAGITLRAANQQAGELAVRAESAAAARIAEAELAAGSVREQIAGEVERERTAARAEAEALIADARERARGAIDQAQQSRRRVVADMAQRRRAIHLQIEQLRAARDELAKAVLSVRESVDRIVDGLGRADDDARFAAAAVARQQTARADQGRRAGEDDQESEAGTLVLGEVGPVAEDGGGGEEEEAGTATAGVPTDEVPVVEVVEIIDVAEVVEIIDVAEADETGEAAVTDPGAVEALFARIRAGSDSDPQVDGVEKAADGAVSADEEAEPTLSAVREADLGPIAGRLARRVKRALQDDQNRVLDRLRSGSGTWSEDLLVPEEEQRAAFVAAALGPLEEAVVAGTAFAAGYGGDGEAPDQAIAREAADALAVAVVTLLRRRFTGEGGVPAGSGHEEAADRVGAAYREWRGERIERLVGDYALGAYSAAVVQATGKKSGMRWVIGDGLPACADCDDNALEGVVAAGAEFPTGHRHPPAHAGCRCIVVPTPE